MSMYNIIYTYTYIVSQTRVHESPDMDRETHMFKETCTNNMYTKKKHIKRTI